MNYLVGRKVFATSNEASAYANWYLRQTRIVLAVLATNRKEKQRICPQQEEGF